MNWVRLARDILLVCGILLAVAYWLLLTFGNLSLSVDAHYYWAANPASLYPHPELAEKNGYNYSPAFELAVAWGRVLPFDVFVAIWRAILLGALVYLAGPFTLFVLLWGPVASEVNAANIQILLALAVVLGFRWPGTWAFVILTKLSPAVGLLWFVVRREWRALGIVAATTATLIVVSLFFAGDQWPGYFTLVTSGKAPSVSPFYLSLWQRLPFAIAIVLFGAWKGWRWTVPVAATLALPVFYFTSLSMLVGVLPFVREWLGTQLEQRGMGLERRAGAATATPDG